MAYDNLKATRDAVYKKFDDGPALVQAGGLAPDYGFMADPEGKFTTPAGISVKPSAIILLEYSDEVTSRVYEFSRGLRQLTPSVLYGDWNAHSTVAVSKQLQGYDPEDLENRLDQVIDVLKNDADTLRTLGGKFQIGFPRWDHKQDSAIARAVSANDDDGFYGFAASVTGHGLVWPDGSPIAPGWSPGHMTVGRFTTEQKDPETLEALGEYVRNARPIGTARPYALAIGYHNMLPGSNADGKGLDPRHAEVELNILERIPFK